MQSEGAADEARKEGSGGDTHSMIGTQEAVARVCGTKTNGTEPTNDSGYVEQVRVDNVVRQEVEFESGDAGMGRQEVETNGMRILRREGRSRERNAQSGRERRSSPVRTRESVRRDDGGMLRGGTKARASRSVRATGHRSVRNRTARVESEVERRDTEGTEAGEVERGIRKEGRVRSDGDGSVT